MPRYRVTIRFGRPRQQYAVVEVEAAGLADALRRAADAVPPDAASTADLAEVRRQHEPESREYGPG